MHRVLEELRATGFSVLHVDHVHDLLRLASSLGRVIPAETGLQLDQVIAGSKPARRARSFTFHYGLGDFPLHTDTVYWPLPARYVVMWAAREFKTPTTILGSHQVSELLSSFKSRVPIFTRKSKTGPIYSSPWFGENDEYVRYDPCYMAAANGAASALSQELDAAAMTVAEDFFWKPHTALILDNWRCLHGRRGVLGEERALSRIYIEEAS